MSTERSKRKPFPWVQAAVAAVVVGALIVLGAQIFERQLHPESAGIAPAPPRPSTLRKFLRLIFVLLMTFPSP